MQTKASAIAQGLRQSVTFASKMFGSDERLYLKLKRNRAIGLIKVGTKRLFLNTLDGLLFGLLSPLLASLPP